VDHRYNNIIALQALVVKLQQDAYKFPGRIVEFKVQSQSAEQSPTASQAQAPPMPGPASTPQIHGLPQGVHCLPSIRCSLVSS
jgi:hypothetical protein